jgi:transposase, IS30 family
MMALQPDKKSARIVETQLKWFSDLPKPMRKTLTHDNGTEFAMHHKLSQAIDMKTFFCDPHSP